MRKTRFWVSFELTVFLGQCKDRDSGQALKYGDYSQYQYGDKNNELQKYKQQLDNEINHFDVIDLDEDCNQCEDNAQIQGSSQQGQRGVVRIVVPSKDNQQHINDYSTCSNVRVKQACKRKQLQNQIGIKGTKMIEGSNAYDVKPMQLVDFQDQDEQQYQISGGQEQSPNPPQTLNDVKLEPLPYKNHIQKNLPSNMSPISSHEPFSPNQTQEGDNLEESSCIFLEHYGNSQETPTQLDPDQGKIQNNYVSPKRTSSQKQYMERLAQKNNPLQDSVDYSTNQDQLKGIKIHSVPFQQDVEIEVVDKKLFISSRIPPGIILKCKLKRSTGFFSLMSPQYDLYLQNGLKHLISAKKNSFRNHELFHLSTQTSNFDVPIRSLMANVLHNKYWLVDQPKVIGKKRISGLDLLVQYGTVSANMGREMLVLCPLALKYYHIGLEHGIRQVDFQQFKRDILRLRNYQHNSNTSKKSQKDFSLIDSDEQDQQQQSLITKKTQQIHVRKTSLLSNEQQSSKPVDKTKMKQSQKYLYLKMQKQSQTIFNIQIQHPLTPLQAMATVLTRFDVQLK